MRGNVSTVIVLVICLIAVLLYQFLGKPKLTEQIESIGAENIQLEERLNTIQQMELQLPAMMKKLPEWRSKLELYQVAIPNRIDDDIFLSALSEQLEAQGVELLSLQVAKGGAWLGELGEAQVEALEAKGIDPDVARQIKVAFYAVRLTGDFGGVLRAFENLKLYNRLYSIDQVMGPVSGGGGMVSASTATTDVPIEITGRIYYGIPDNYLTVEALVEVFATAVMIPSARGVHGEIVSRGRDILTESGQGVEPSGETSSAGMENDDPAGGATDTKQPEPDAPVEVTTT